MKALIVTVDEREEELLDRILAVVHGNVTAFEPQKQDSYCLVFPGLSIDGLHHTVLCGGREIELTHVEFEILYLLAKHPGIVFSKEQIYDAVRGEAGDGDGSIITNHIHNIREKIEPDPARPVYIQTIWGVGYRFNSGKKME